MEGIKKFDGGIVSWETFVDLHINTSILFDRIKHIVNSAIGLSDWKTTDLLPFDIIEDLVEHQELRLKNSWESADDDKCSKQARDSAMLLNELRKANRKIGGLEYRLEQYEGKERTDLKVLDGE
jgi:hypothetical protein